MKAIFTPQPILAGKAVEILMKQLGLAKASEFWASLGYGKQDYTKLRKKIFAKETIQSLSKKIQKT